MKRGSKRLTTYWTKDGTKNGTKSSNKTLKTIKKIGHQVTLTLKHPS